MTERKMGCKPLIMALCLLALTVGITGCIRGVLSFADLTLTSPDMEKYEELPVAFLRDGGNLSPALDWSTADIPHGTRSFAVICDDLDTPDGVFNHWVMYNIPADVRKLDKGIAKLALLPNGTKQGLNGFGEIGYDGPQNREPEHPVDSGSHRVNFKLYALNKTLDIADDATKEDVVEAMLHAIVGEGHIMVNSTGTLPAEEEEQEQ